jgi:hypothetical protein
MRTEEAIKKKIDEVKELWEKNPDYWQGFREGLEWVLGIHMHFDNIHINSVGQYSLKIE